MFGSFLTWRNPLPGTASPHVEAARQALCDEAVSLENEVGRLGQVRGKLLECADMHIHLCTLLADVPQKTDYILPMATYERKVRKITMNK